MSNFHDDGGLSSGPYGAQEEPPNAIIPLILGGVTFLFCCQPFGIAGLVLAALGMSKGGSGDVEGAQKMVRYSYICSGTGIVGGLILYFLIIVMVIISEMM